MSYYFGITLKDSLLFGCDRTFNNPITGENRNDSKRYSILGSDRAFFPTGNLGFCAMVERLIHNAFEFGLENLENGDSIDSGLSKLFSSTYLKVKKDNISKLQAIGKSGEIENVDCFYGGLNDGAPFIIVISSTDDFQLKLIDKPMQYVCLNQSPEVLEYVAKTLKAFMGAIADKGTDEVWDLGKKFLPGVIQKISKVDPLVSANGDLIFVSVSGVQAFEF